jgi:hypothetical protein
MTAQTTALNITSPAALNALATGLNQGEVNSRALPCESWGHTFRATYQGECALSGAKIWQGDTCRMVRLPHWPKPRAALNAAYGVVANLGWVEGDDRPDGTRARTWTGRLLTSQVTAEEVLTLLAAFPGGINFRVWDRDCLRYGDHYAPTHTWSYCKTGKYLHTGKGGSSAKTRAQAARSIINAQAFACTFC